MSPRSVAGSRPIPSKAHPELLADLQTKLTAAISSIAATLQFYQQAVDSAQQLVEQSRAAVGGQTAQNRDPRRASREAADAARDGDRRRPRRRGRDVEGARDARRSDRRHRATPDLLPPGDRHVHAAAEQVATALDGLDAGDLQLGEAPGRSRQAAADGARRRPGAQDAFTAAQKDLTEAISLATQQQSFFQGAPESFQAFADQADIAVRGRRGARAQLGRHPGADRDAAPGGAQRRRRLGHRVRGPAEALAAGLPAGLAGAHRRPRAEPRPLPRADRQRARRRGAAPDRRGRRNTQEARRRSRTSSRRRRSRRRPMPSISWPSCSRTRRRSRIRRRAEPTKRRRSCRRSRASRGLRTRRGRGPLHDGHAAPGDRAATHRLRQQHAARARLPRRRPPRRRCTTTSTHMTNAARAARSELAPDCWS